MSRVIAESYGQTQEMDLESFLTPDARSGGGISERAFAQAEENAKAIGKLAAVMVDRGLVSLEELMLAQGFRYWQKAQLVRD